MAKTGIKCTLYLDARIYLHHQRNDKNRTITLFR